MQVSKVTLNDIYLTIQDLASNGGFLKFDKELYNRMHALDMHANAEFFETQSLLGCRYDELDAVTNALSSVTEEDVEAKAFYQSRKEQLVTLTNELSDKLDAIKDDMKTQYVEVSEEDFQAFAKANKWNIDNGQARTEFAKGLRVAM